MTNYRVPAALEFPLEKMAEKSDVRISKLITAILQWVVDYPENLAKVSLHPHRHKQKVAIEQRAVFDLAGSPPLTDTQVAMMLHNYGAKGKATLAKYREKITDENGEFIEPRVIKMVRALAEAKWLDPTLRRAPRAIPPHKLIGQRYGNNLVLSVIDRYNLPRGAEFIQTMASPHTWALCRCDCGNLFYHAVGSIRSARCGGKLSPRDTHHYEPNPEHECPLLPRRLGNVIGRKFAELTVIGKSPTKGKLLVQCRCGTIKHVHASALYSGRTKSCGCWQEALWSSSGKPSKRASQAGKLGPHPTGEHPLPPAPVADDLDDLN